MKEKRVEYRHPLAFGFQMYCTSVAEGESRGKQESREGNKKRKTEVGREEE